MKQQRCCWHRSALTFSSLFVRLVGAAFQPQLLLLLLLLACAFALLLLFAACERIWKTNWGQSFICLLNLPGSDLPLWPPRSKNCCVQCSRNGNPLGTPCGKSISIVSHLSKKKKLKNCQAVRTNRVDRFCFVFGFSFALSNWKFQL